MTRTPNADSVNDVLLWIAVKGLVPREELEGKMQGEGSERLDDLINQGIIGADSGYVYLTDRGDHALTEYFQASLNDAERSELETFVDTFEILDRELKSAATDWQTQRDGDDADALVAAIERWYAADEELANVLRDNPVAMRTVGRLAEALADARARFAAGDRDAFTGVDENSYHSFWFLMHEQLLRTTGRQRNE